MLMRTTKFNVMKFFHLIIIAQFAWAACGTRQSSAEQEKSAAPENVVLLSDSEMQTAGIAVGQPEKGPVSNYLKVHGDRKSVV